MKNTATVLAIVLIVVLAVLLLGGAGMMGFGGFGMMSGFGGRGGMMGGNGMMGGYGGMMSGYGFNPIGSIISLVIWALVIGGIVWLVVWLARNVNTTTNVSSNSAIDIAKARYARGEITKEQFDEMKKVLEA